MNTSQLRKNIYDRAGQLFDPPFTHSDINALLELIVDSITDGLLNSEPEGDEEERKVMLRSFGTFRLIKRRGRTYSVRGEEHTVPERYTVVFKPGAELLRAIADKFGESVGSPLP
jgi:nucleoid DNA-binding protein